MALKRPASTSRGRSAKRTCAEIFAAENAQKASSIAHALKVHGATPTSVREVLTYAAPHSLLVKQADRHAFDNVYVDNIGKTLEEIKGSMEAEISKYQALVDGAEPMKVEREAAVKEATDSLENLKAARDQAKTQYNDDVQAVKELKSAFALAKKPKGEGNPEVVKLKEKTEALQTALRGAFLPSQEKLGDAKTIEALEKVSSENGYDASLLTSKGSPKKAEEEKPSTFGDAVATQVDEVFSKKIADLSGEILMSAAEAKARASKDAFMKACSTQVEGEKTLISKSQELANWAPDVKFVADKLDEAVKGHAEFVSGPMQAFSELKELAEPPPEPEPVVPEPEPVPEAVAEPAPEAVLPEAEVAASQNTEEQPTQPTN